ncbi:adhesion G protein-coupled receptor E1-like [Leptodactylus fuscus]
MEMDPSCSRLREINSILNTYCDKDGNITTQKANDTLTRNVQILSNIITEPANATNNNTSTTTTTILTAVEMIVLKSFVDEPRNQLISTPQLSVSMKTFSNVCSSDTMPFQLALNDNTMRVPCDELDHQRGGGVFIVYKGDKFRLGSSQVTDHDSKSVIISSVVTGAITGHVTSGNMNVTFQLAHVEVVTPSHNLTCMFWDTKKNNWSAEGCKKETSNGSHTTCSCNHLSSFAIIMSPSGLKDNFALAIITKIGLSLSVVCLVLSLLTFILCRSLRSAHMSVLTAMCSCLLLGQVLFLVGVDKTFYKILCAIIAGGLHFLFLCAFCWMSIESVLLFMTVRNLRAVNYMTSRRSNFPVMCLLGFGVPVVIVGITAAIQSDGYGTDKYCWLRPKSTVWSFLGPVLVFIIANTTLLVFTVIILRQRLATLNSSVSTLKNTRLLTFKALFQLFILGSTWGIGYFQFGRGSLVISYIFTICNSLQGVYIFLVHCIFSSQVREEYRKTFCKARKRGKQSTDDSPQNATKSITVTEMTKPASSETTSTLEKRVFPVLEF